MGTGSISQINCTSSIENKNITGNHQEIESVTNDGPKRKYSKIQVHSYFSCGEILRRIYMFWKQNSGILIEIIKILCRIKFFDSTLPNQYDKGR